MEGLILVAVGCFSAGCAAADADWFMEHRKARMVSALLGRQGARGFYMLLGLGIGMMGLGLTTGIIAG